MKKIEVFLNEYSWLLKLGIFLFFVFWAGQGFYLMQAVKDVKSQEFNYDPEAQRQLSLLASRLAVKAEQKGKAYSPQDYFRDLIEVQKGRKDLSPDKSPLPRPQNEINRLWIRSMDNTRDNTFSDKDIEEGKAIFAKWLGENLQYVCEDIDCITTKLKADAHNSRSTADDWHAVRAWLISLYLRGLILSAMLYLVRMAKGFESEETYWSNDARMPLNKRRRGILDTVLAGKAKFLLAILTWPFMLLKYPANVIREIVVEAELRRLGGLFKKFSPTERLKIREIANGEQYASWRKSFRRDHASSFRYAFAVALFATLAVYLLSPILKAEARELGRAGPVISACYELQEDRGTDDDVGSPVWCEEGGKMWSPPAMSARRFRLAENIFPIPGIVRCIDSVPRFGCFSGLAAVAFNH